MTTEFPDILKPLFDPHPFKVCWGGRGGLKTFGMADALLIMGSQRYERILCARETMDSIKESVHQTLEDRIRVLGLGGRYEVLKSTILGPAWGDGRRTEFIFTGLRYDIGKVKSMEGITKCWVEEAQGVSEHSWKTLLPTIRWQDKAAGRSAEVWISFNPELATDATYKRWVLNPPPGTWSCFTTYLDNPWFDENPMLRTLMEHDKRTNDKTYRNVWLGECISEVEGAIYASELAAARKDGRICDLPVDRSRPVSTFWDLGFGDKMAIWFAQSIGPWHHVIDYMEGSGRTISDYIFEMQSKGYVYGTDWLPHDASDAIIHHRLVAAGSRKSPEQALRDLGRSPRIGAKDFVMHGIDQVRRTFPMLRFDQTRCADGIQRLSHYRMGEDAATTGAERRTPVHDINSHGADALRLLCQCVKPEAAKPVQRPAPPPRVGAWG